MSNPLPVAVVAGEIFTDLVEVTDDVAALDSAGVWVVVAPFQGDPVCARFAGRRTGTVADVASPETWSGLGDDAEWESSLDRDTYVGAVRRIQASIERGELAQVNLTRRCSAPLPDDADIVAFSAALAAANPAPCEAVVAIPSHGIRVASASPELFLRIDGDRISSSPIKGTTSVGGSFPAKDYVENRLVTGMVAAELAAVCVPGSIRVTADCAVETHPGLDHLVSTVEGTLVPDIGWADVFATLTPPASVTGSPRDTALSSIDELEPVPRGPYCGTVGVVDNDRGRALLNVAIRTFWFADGQVHFGTGAGITAGSDPEAEWSETELKAARLLGIATGAQARISS